MYVGGLLEKVTTGRGTDWRHYVKVGDQTIAIMSRKSSSTNTTRYVLEDLLGSPSQILASDGTSYVQEAFSPFGARRDPATRSDACQCDDLAKIKDVSRHGYTGHEAIGGVTMGLNHMNGRVQDAITGRFLSPDPYVAEPRFTQAWNRYSYAYNNPMSFTDPSGFVVLCFRIDVPGNIVLGGGGGGPDGGGGGFGGDNYLPGFSVQVCADIPDQVFLPDPALDVPQEVKGPRLCPDGSVYTPILVDVGGPGGTVEHSCLTPAGRADIREVERLSAVALVADLAPPAWVSLSTTQRVDLLGIFVKIIGGTGGKSMPRPPTIPRPLPPAIEVPMPASSQPGIPLFP
jgi:RHS repeat-associated protein